MAKETDLTIFCPLCGGERTIVWRSWRNTFRDDLVWNGKAREYQRLDGPGHPIQCWACDAEPEARDWHREYERREFAKKGWVTPRMNGGAP